MKNENNIINLNIYREKKKSLKKEEIIKLIADEAYMVLLAEISMDKKITQERADSMIKKHNDKYNK